MDDCSGFLKENLKGIRKAEMVYFIHFATNIDFSNFHERDDDENMEYFFKIFEVWKYGQAEYFINSTAKQVSSDVIEGYFPLVGNTLGMLKRIMDLSDLSSNANTAHMIEGSLWILQWSGRGLEHKDAQPIIGEELYKEMFYRDYNPKVQPVQNFIYPEYMGD
jgi:hypothetical protein